MNCFFNQTLLFKFVQNRNPFAIRAAYKSKIYVSQNGSWWRSPPKMIKRPSWIWPVWPSRDCGILPVLIETSLLEVGSPSLLFYAEAFFPFFNPLISMKLFLFYKFYFNSSSFSPLFSKTVVLWLSVNSWLTSGFLFFIWLNNESIF